MDRKLKKMTVKDLTEELQIVKEQVKEIPYLKQTIIELLAIVENLKSQEVDVVTKSKPSLEPSSNDTFECRKCNYTSSSKKSLQKHVNEQHPRRIECDSCDQTFGNNHELETHVEEHKAQKNFKCEVCDKGFYLQWRLQKHKSVHLETTKKCHFYTSKRTCPFELIGCKFKHEDQDPDNQNVECYEDVEISDNDNEDVDEEDNEEILENQCHLCMMQLETGAELIIHFQFHHPQFHSMMQSRSQTVIF